MEQLKQMVMERAGISEEQADKVIDAVRDFIQNNPDKLTDMLPGGIGEKLGGLFGR